MPVITLECGVISKEQKKELIENFTQSASRITKIPEQSFIVLIKESIDDNIGVGGKVLSEIKKA